MDDATRSVEQTAEALLQTLRLARALAGAERPTILDGFDRQVGLVCAKAMDLPPDRGRSVRPRLILLLAEVEAVTAQLHANA